MGIFFLLVDYCIFCQLSLMNTELYMHKTYLLTYCVPVIRCSTLSTVNKVRLTPVIDELLDYSESSLSACNPQRTDHRFITGLRTETIQCTGIGRAGLWNQPESDCCGEK